ncbi:MAG TPA: TIM44-like domain-containing protein [Candidatus Acidoferrum sp.]|nr:TIM44-like domain-containing protein [Candidatus Acidoferrum sp.]
MISADPSGLLPDMPNGLTYLLLRPLILPLALVCLGIGFVLWRFMGDIPSVLGMGFQVLFDALRRDRSPVTPASGPTRVSYSTSDGVADLQGQDPSFSAASLLSDVQRIGAIAVAAWAARDLAPCRPFLTDDCWAAQTAQLGRPAAEGWRPFASSVALIPESIMAAQRNASTDRITVRVHINPQSGSAKVVRGRRIGRWIEDWRLIRTRAVPAVGRSAPVAAGPWLIERMDHAAVHFERAA